MAGGEGGEEVAETAQKEECKLLIVIVILAILSVLYAIFCYVDNPTSNEQLVAQRTESIIFLLFAIFLLLSAILYNSIKPS